MSERIYTGQDEALEAQTMAFTHSAEAIREVDIAPAPKAEVAQDLPPTSRVIKFEGPDEEPIQVTPLTVVTPDMSTPLTAGGSVAAKNLTLAHNAHGAAVAVLDQDKHLGQSQE